MQLSAAGWFSLCIPEKVIGGSLLTLSHYQPKLIEKGIRKTPRHYRMSFKACKLSCWLLLAIECQHETYLLALNREGPSTIA